jgi:hypothetical protein
LEERTMGCKTRLRLVSIPHSNLPRPMNTVNMVVATEYLQSQT